MPSFGQLFVSIGANIEGISKGFDDTEKSIKGFARRLDGLGRNFQDLGTRLSLGVTAPLAALGGIAVKVAGDFEQTEVAFTTLLGSAEKAGTFLKELEAFAARTPFEFPELTDAAKRLLAFGFEAEQIIPTMTAIGDAAAGLGGGAETIDRVSRALGQIQAKGKASTEELLQLSEVGIGSFKILQEQLGLTGAELEKALRTGAIDAQTAITALLTGIGEQFSGQMEKQSQTLLGQISTLKDEFGFVVRDLGTALLPFAKDALNVLKPVVAAIAEIVKAFAEAPAPIRTAGVVFAGLAAAVGPALIAIGTLASSVAGLVPLFTAGGPLAGAFAGFGGILAAVTGPVGIAVAAIAGIGIALYAFRDDIANSRIGEIWSETWENVTASLTQAFDGLTTALGNFTAAFVARWEEGLFGLRPVIEGVWSGIGSIFAGALETISAIVSGGLEIITGIINVFAQLLSGNFEGAWEAAKGVFRAALGTIVEIVGAQVGAILGIIDGFASALGKSLNLQETFDKEVDGVLKALDRQSTGMKGAEKSVKELGGEVEKTGDVVGKLPTKFKFAEKAVKSFDQQVAEAIKNLEKQAKQEKIAAIAAQEYAVKHDDARRGVERLRFDIEKTTREIEESTKAQQSLARAISAEVVPSINQATQASIGLVVAATNTQTTIAGTEQGFYSLAEAIAGFGIKSQSIANNELAQLRNQLEVIRKQAAEGNPDALRALKQAEKEYADAVKAAGGPVEATSIWGDALKQVSTVITDFGKSVAQDLGQHIKTGIGFIDSMTESLLRLVSEKVFGAVLKHFQSLKDFIPSLSNVKDLLKDIGAALGIGSSVASTAGTVAGTAGTAAGQAAGAAGEIAGSVGSAGGAAGAATTGALATASAVTGIVTGIVSAVTGIIGVFQSARQETTLNAIEENTRRGTLYLGDRGDQGILGTQFRIAENSDYIVGNTDEIKATAWDIRGLLQGFASAGIMVAGLSLSPQAGAARVAAFEPTEFAGAVSRGVDLSQLRVEFEAAQRTATNQLDELQQQTAQLEAIQDAIEDQGPTVVVNIQNAFAGSPQEFARMVSKEIEKQLRTSTRGIR